MERLHISPSPCMKHLNKPYLGCWMVDHGSPTSPVPLSWPPNSHNLTTLGNSLWGFIKGGVCCVSCAEMWDRILPVCHRCMSHRTWWYVRLCFEHDDAHMDPLDVTWLSSRGMLSGSMVTSWSPIQLNPKLAAPFWGRLQKVMYLALKKR
jgi:hypothetical protein